MSDTGPGSALMSPLLDSREVAAYLKVSESTLSRWRTDQKGPPFLRLGGGVIRYKLDAVDTWLESLLADERH